MSAVLTRSCALYCVFDTHSTVHELVCDLGSMESVRKCAEDFKALNLPLHVLINNAGVMVPPFTKTVEGFELQFGTNVLGHVLLTNLLLPKLKASTPSRVVNVASEGHKLAPKGGILWGHLKDGDRRCVVRLNQTFVDATMLGATAGTDFVHFAVAGASPSACTAAACCAAAQHCFWRYYGQSKLGNMLHALALTKQLQGTGVTAHEQCAHQLKLTAQITLVHNCCSVAVSEVPLQLSTVLLTADAVPAAIVAVAVGVINTNLARHKLFARIFYAVTALISKSEPQGAATNVYCAFGEVEGGAYYADCNKATPGHASFTPEIADKLFTFACEATNSKLP
eukprot:723-Heterococcus_DN1.PRE.3